MDKHDLYELCVQSVEHLAPLLRAIHGGQPTMLGEDFCGTAALSRRWCELKEGATALGVDLDPEALARCPETPGVRLVQDDVRSVSDPVDVLFVGNFSIGYHHTRAELVSYLTHARARMNPGGVFVCDTYGGESAFLTGAVHRPHPIPKSLDGVGGRICRYTWEQRHADPLTGMVTDVIHFRVEDCGEIVEEIPDAFVYEWRLWSVPELRDAMAEAGFARTDVYAGLADAVDDDGNAYVTPVADAESELDDSFIVLVAGRAPGS
ncbi:MAG: class I SAM-dependent methyltransferase [Phycisphaerales bacterium]